MTCSSEAGNEMRPMGLKALLMIGALAATCAAFRAAPVEPDPEHVTIWYRHGLGVTIPIVEITPAPEYRRWFDGAARCSGLTGDYTHIRWYMTPQPWPRPGNGSTYGLYIPSDSVHGWDRIILNAPELMDSGLVAHESLHHLLHQSGWQPADTTRAAIHPSPPFGICSWGRAW